MSRLRPTAPQVRRAAGRTTSLLSRGFGKVSRLLDPPPPPEAEPEPEEVVEPEVVEVEEAPPEPPPGTVIELDYPVEPRARYGWVDAAHPQLTRLLDEQRHHFAEVLRSFVPYVDELRKVPIEATTPTEPSYMNGWLPSLDGISLYGFVATRRPATVLEVGSGNSTKWIRRAIEQHGLDTRIVSIDPAPRAEIDGLCDEVLRVPFEEADLAVVDGLVPGDVVFIDNSHRSFMNSDATVALLELLPRVPAGVLVGIHDIWIPADYPPEWVDRWYSEQYVLAAFLLGGHAGFRIELPAWYVSYDPELSGGILADLWESEELSTLVEREGAGFWLSRTDPPQPYRSRWISPKEGFFPGPFEG